MDLGGGITSHIFLLNNLTLIFVNFFKKENKVRNKNSSVTHFLEKQVYEKSSPNLEVMLPIGKVQ